MGDKIKRHSYRLKCEDDKSMSCDWGKVEESFDVANEVRREYESDLTVDTLNALCREVQGWIQTDDPDFLDSAVILIHKENAAIRGVLLDEISNLAEARLNRKIRVGTGERRKYRREELRSIQGLYGNYPQYISNKLAFTLIEICGLNTEESYRYVSRIIRRDYRKEFELTNSALNMKLRTIQSCRTVRRHYEKFKETNEFASYKRNEEWFLLRNYPNMTKEEIRKHLLKDIRDDEY